MEKAGIRRADAMQISGHLTESVYKRYDIGKEKAAVDTGKKLAEYEEQQANKRRQAKQFANEFANEGEAQSSGTDSPIDRKKLN